MEALRRSGYPQSGPLIEWCQGMLAKHLAYTREYLEDMPEVRDWVWTDTSSPQPSTPRPT
jgi:xylulose-5-phosphate/fructose-6-phosphate phosphoketolase